jgi:HEAT repeat protein
VAELARALSDPDPVTRGLAAIELRARGAAARPALDALAAALRDSDANVRMMAGNAIAAMGPAAVSALPALVAACSVRDEQVQVLRACAAAPGAIGPGADPALPILREIAKQPRVRWAAEAAIRSIGGEAALRSGEPR